MTVVRSVVARVFVDDLDTALPAYEALAGGVETKRFEFRDVRLAWVGPFLLLQVAPERRAEYERRATLIVDDIEAARSVVEEYGGEVLEGPAPAPNGARMIARHVDGAVFEYIAPDGPALSR
ncbi:hypothetical protein P5P86_16975 [Nocardioides sp. BP30]|uniref:VOC family protein n=1 Tax=Nocardioides sp. BP30 TaxID=3036374 RepID=UPI002468DB18|nr:hypothetical protein [Nocardioides sp. BP30]WGL51641.1 hypothetical protein P5P86_16975 [Nocardioides sp. BP30]